MFEQSIGSKSIDELIVKGTATPGQTHLLPGSLSIEISLERKYTKESGGKEKSGEKGPVEPYTKENPRCWRKQVASFRYIKSRPKSDRSLYEHKRHSFEVRKKNGYTVRMNFTKASMINCYWSFEFYCFLLENACQFSILTGPRDGSRIAFYAFENCKACKNSATRSG